MRVFYDLPEIQGKIPNAAVTVGSFDGVHAGHREILRVLNEFAEKNNGESVVITFAPHPRHVLQPDDGSLRLLNSLEEKIYLLEQAGVDNLFVIRFTPEFSRLGSEEFARRYLFEGIGAKSVVMGYNHHFGHDRKGKEFMESLRADYDFEIYQLPKQLVTDHKVSSTVVRRLIREGNLKAAREMLGMPYFLIAGVAESGQAVYDEPYKLLPPPGVYPVCIEDGGRSVDTDMTVNEDGIQFPDSLRFDYHPEKKLFIRFVD